MQRIFGWELQQPGISQCATETSKLQAGRWLQEIEEELHGVDTISYHMVLLANSWYKRLRGDFAFPPTALRAPVSCDPDPTLPTTDGWEEEGWYTQFVIPHCSADRWQRPVEGTDDQLLLLADLVDRVMLRHKSIRETISRHDLYWIDNQSIAKKRVRSYLEAALAGGHDLAPLVINPEQQAFVTGLCNQYLGHASRYEQMLIGQAERWEVGRMYLLDKVLLKMALAEKEAFPDSPLASMIAGYLDIADRYSTAKSTRFIHAILGKLWRGMTPADVAGAGIEPATFGL